MAPDPTLDDFWASIADAWGMTRGGTRAVGGLTNSSSYFRRVAVTAVNVLQGEFLKNLERRLRSYSSEGLRAWDAHLQAVLAGLERPDVKDALGSPSEESFLYARAWVVTAGREYWKRVDETPGIYGMEKQWTEGILYVAENVHTKRYGAWKVQTDSVAQGSKEDSKKDSKEEGSKEEGSKEGGSKEEESKEGGSKEDEGK